LPVRRICLQILRTIQEATRWAVFEQGNARLASRLRAQVSDYLACLAELGAFNDHSYIVECDVGLRQAVEEAGQGFAIFIAFHPLGCPEPVSFTLHQSVEGCRVASTAFAPASAGQQRQSI
jgi:hypothetical protein